MSFTAAAEHRKYSRQRARLNSAKYLKALHVTIVGRNKQFLPLEEIQISSFAKIELGNHMTIITNKEIIVVRDSISRRKNATSGDDPNGKKRSDEFSP